MTNDEKISSIVEKLHRESGVPSDNQTHTDGLAFIRTIASKTASAHNPEFRSVASEVMGKLKQERSSRNMWYKAFHTPAFWNWGLAAAAVFLITIIPFQKSDNEHPLHTYGTGLSIGSSNSLSEHDITYNDSQIAQSVISILTYIGGSFGAVVMFSSTFGGFFCLALFYSNRK